MLVQCVVTPQSSLRIKYMHKNTEIHTHCHNAVWVWSHRFLCSAKLSFLFLSGYHIFSCFLLSCSLLSLSPPFPHLLHHFSPFASLSSSSLPPLVSVSSSSLSPLSDVTWSQGIKCHFSAVTKVQFTAVRPGVWWQDESSPSLISSLPLLLPFFPCIFSFLFSVLP